MDKSGIPFKILVTALTNSSGKTIKQEVFDQITSSAYPSIKSQQINYLMTEASQNDQVSNGKLQLLA